MLRVDAVARRSPCFNLMELFPPDPALNLLPCAGVVNYYGRVMTGTEADRVLGALMSGVPWRSDEVLMFGKRLVTARKVAWFGDAGCAYTYSGVTREPIAWSEEVLALKALVEGLSGARFNSCLLNLYHSGAEGMGWHSDDEKMLAKDAAIASLSLGAGRRFYFKHKQLDLKKELMLEHGSLLIMQGETQRHWLHRLPPMTRVLEPRINLTFRRIDAVR
jgi:alkylated DNA repair dioxygenase AlkB